MSSIDKPMSKKPHIDVDHTIECLMKSLLGLSNLAINNSNKSIVHFSCSIDL